VWFGALITGLLFEVGKTAVSWYLGREGTASAYGAAGSVVFVLMWVYFASSILFFGAEFTQVYADAYEGVAVPAVNAFYVPVGKRGRRNRQAPVMAIAKSPPPPVLPALLSGTLAVLAKIITPAFIKSTILPHALKFLAKK
jgi:membrane protein